jgi:hypothetical protein
LDKLTYRLSLHIEVEITEEHRVWQPGQAVEDVVWGLIGARPGQVDRHMPAFKVGWHDEDGEMRELTVRRVEALAVHEPRQD